MAEISPALKKKLAERKEIAGKKAKEKNEKADRKALKKDGKAELKALKKNGKFGNKKLTESSKRYLRRQVKDIYSDKARKEGYRSRAAYKLLEIDEKFDILKGLKSVVDLGSAPGSWSQISARYADKVIALDKIEMEGIRNVDMIVGDFTEDECLEELEAMCPAGIDMVISDMAPETSGISAHDHLRQMSLADMAADFALNNLNKGGHFVCKIFVGGEEKDYQMNLRKHFETVKFFKPQSSRKDSRETFIVAVNFQG